MKIVRRENDPKTRPHSKDLEAQYVYGYRRQDASDDNPVYGMFAVLRLDVTSFERREWYIEIYDAMIHSRNEPIDIHISRVRQFPAYTNIENSLMRQRPPFDWMAKIYEYLHADMLEMDLIDEHAQELAFKEYGC